MPLLYKISSGGGILEGWRIGDAPVIVGRGEIADLRVCDDHLSRAHFAISRTEEGFVLCDLRSRNGTWVRGERVTRLVLHPNDRFRAGRSLFVFEEGLSTAVAALDGCHIGDTEVLAR